MRGQDGRSGSLFSYVDLEQRVRPDHPLRTIRTLVNEALASLDGRFGEIPSEIGRPSIPPEQLLRAMLLQAFSVRSERQLMEQLDFNLLFRWFVGLGVGDPVWDASTFSKNRDRLLGGPRGERPHGFRPRVEEGCQEVEDDGVDVLDLDHVAFLGRCKRKTRGPHRVFIDPGGV